MTILNKINFTLVTLLGLTASLPKILRMPQEVEFFNQVGLGSNAVLAFGLVQLLAALLLLAKKTRFWGAAATAIVFALSAIMLLVNGQAAFGIVSFIPVVLACLVMKNAVNAERPS